MTKVVVGAADQAIISELRGMATEIEGAEIISYLESTTELSAYVARVRPDVVLLHDRLGPQATADVVREVTFRSPATSVLVVNTKGDLGGAIGAMEAGAKGVLSYPLAFDDLLSKFEAARGWSERMSGLLTGAVADSARELGRHGRLTVVAGAKGGVGATTVATHMAIDLQRKVAGIKVCLVDLDLQAGDVSAILDARRRVSIADVAKVSQDLSASTILDALVEHESGISLLLTPVQVAETEHVTASAVRAILSLLRQEFDVILVDGGSHATPAQAAAVEVADEVVVVVTPDVLAMRSYRRTVEAWESLGVRAEQELHVLVNRVSRDDVLNMDALGRLTSARLVGTPLPAMFRRLERGINARNPDEVNEASWWKGLERIGGEIGVHGAPTRTGPSPTSSKDKPKRRRGTRAKVRSEAGQVAVETVALVPLVIFVCLLVWQLGLTALSLSWAGNAANAAAREYAVSGDLGKANEAARDALPSGMRDAVRVAVDGDSVRVVTQVPVLCTGCGGLGEISQSSHVVEEP
ncbi:AAA family ATPase [Nocardioides sp. MH1]|uniref:AAA family ATPase n=1 Tax=Nocardioides sp. MH1 TaxID=3242490 RepID=UPI003521F687